jgi:hypothetical protein
MKGNMFVWIFSCCYIFSELCLSFTFIHSSVQSYKYIYIYPLNDSRTGSLFSFSGYHASWLKDNAFHLLIALMMEALASLKRRTFYPRLYGAESQTIATFTLLTSVWEVLSHPKWFREVPSYPDWVWEVPNHPDWNWEVPSHSYWVLSRILSHPNWFREAFMTGIEKYQPSWQVLRRIQTCRQGWECPNILIEFEKYSAILVTGFEEYRTILTGFNVPFSIPAECLGTYLETFTDCVLFPRLRKQCLILFDAKLTLFY